ncbi:26S proteasome non-ATPase regulatory subunit 6 [Psilocybe cubensis]|uniref:26S proteasome non-ATPase regulatory subunit 6 n=1 Tax=Psilocybe cubensis TaxID=181762 RepID=A0ACB8HAY6_PSICU|nr:26S proteasome non-ATPase regulatory subunit 6 [Psilocybe cubensis]KAH9484646.1 26S proteasome non-ATPase regulatory subunit 6 [Psilocybe cubensis]
MADEVVLPIPNLELPEKLFILSNPALKHLHDEARRVLLEGLKADQMGPYYRTLTSSPSSPLPLDAALLESMEAENKAELEKLDERLAEAEKTEGESEISDALKARANYLTRIGDKEKSLAAQRLALEKTPGLGSRIDITLTIVRIGFFFNDNAVITTNMADAEKLIDEGGDWDRRNRLKVYRGLHLLSTRQFKRAADLLLDALSTFTASELLSYTRFVEMTVIAAALVLGRVDLRKRVMMAPEVVQVLPDVPILGELVGSFWECKYDKFFIALATLEQTHLLPSRTLSPHARFYTREMRIRAYTQLLESYRSLTLESLSAAFGVSVEFVDSELSHLIALSRLPAKIDKVHRIVSTTRPSLKNAQYEVVVKKGDVLLNQVQRLSKGYQVDSEGNVCSERIPIIILGLPNKPPRDDQIELVLELLQMKKEDLIKIRLP